MRKLYALVFVLLLSCGGDKPTEPQSDPKQTRTYNVASARLPCFRYAADEYCQGRGWVKAEKWKCYTVGNQFYLETCTCTE